MKKQLFIFAAILLIGFVAFAFADEVLWDTNVPALTTSHSNTTITNTIFNVTYDEVQITETSIDFYNLTYQHPNTCNSYYVGEDFFSYGEENVVVDLYNIVETPACDDLC